MFILNLLDECDSLANFSCLYMSLLDRNIDVKTGQIK